MRPLLLLFLAIFILAPTSSPPLQAQEEPARQRLAEMSTAERVGQLFLLSFIGSTGAPNSDIAQLIQEERAGGVVLLAANQNFVNDANAPWQMRALTEELQRIALADGALPLFVSIDHEGDGWPYSRLTGGTTPLPSPMAVGATWNPELARQVGQVTGQELSAAGINLLLGPTVDVLSEPQPTSKGDLGTRVFGGDPYWVGQMGRAYIAGIHEGSAGRMATVAKHFPGHGGSDRLPDDEVATVDKSLQELRRIELAPFFAVTRLDAPDDPAVTEALMSSHIRYRGFQGNIRQFTAPISFDPQGLRVILNEAEFATWREQGLIVSDSLGVPAVQKYFDPTGQTFPHRQIARDALMAGNDLLILAQYSADGAWPTQLANMRDTLAYFRDQYAVDRQFAQRVDEAALRVIRLKLKLYPEMANDNSALPPLPEPLFGAGGRVTEAVAEQSLSLIYPQTQAMLAERLPHPPLRGERIVVFTDARRVRDCFDCPYYPLIATDALQQAILRRYGPEGSGQINEAQIISLSFNDLKLFLGAPGIIESSADPVAAQARADAVAPVVHNAEWILLVMQDINVSLLPGTQTSRYPESDAARLLLDAASGSLFNKRVVAFFMNVPYQLDTTEMSKLSAAYALYSKQPAFIEVAARALFREALPLGAPPVTVEAVNYDLPTQLEPAPGQPITLARQSDEALVAPTESPVESSLIVDRNGHPVPDGTLITLVGSWGDDPDGEATLRLSSVTQDGIAQALIPLRRAGTLAVQVEGAQGEPPLLLSVLAPTPTVTLTSEASATVPSTRTPIATAQPVRTAQPAPPRAAPLLATAVAKQDSLAPSHLLASTIGTLLLAGAVWWRTPPQPLTRRLRLALLAVSGGLMGYLLWGLGRVLGG